MTAVLPYVRVTSAQVIDEYVLELTFEDGTIGRVSFAGREWRGVFEPFRDPATFAEVYVDPQFGTLAWPNGRSATRRGEPPGRSNVRERAGPGAAGRYCVPRRSSVSCSAIHVSIASRRKRT